MKCLLLFTKSNLSWKVCITSPSSCIKVFPCANIKVFSCPVSWKVSSTPRSSAGTGCGVLGPGSKPFADCVGSVGGDSVVVIYGGRVSISKWNY